MNENVEKILGDLNTSITSSIYREREMLKELSELKGKLMALKSMCDIEFDSVPSGILYAMFGWDKKEE